MLDISMKDCLVLFAFWLVPFISRPLMPLILLLISAGTWSWSHAWVYSGFLVALGLTSMIFLGRWNRWDTRLEPQIFIQKEFMELSFPDKLLYACCFGLEYVTYTVVGVDVYRYGWSTPSHAEIILGGVLVLVMYAIALKAIHHYNSSLLHNVLYRYPRSVSVVSALTILGYVLMLGSRWGLLVGGVWGLVNYIFIHRRYRVFSQKRYVSGELHLLYHLSPLRRVLWFSYSAT